ncbi:unnamed protein product [marine sediment metagenome]|uniref:Uncharacterized protein n=1 Tax=marine sediment metagenome TaxID=412755 RepID=X1BTQ5_9ZZZZ
MLFIGPFMFLINNNKTQLRLGGKNSTPGTDNDIKFSVSYSLPLVELFSQREFTVKDSHPMGKA